MRTSHRTLLATILFVLSFVAVNAQSTSVVSLFDAGWKFHRGGAQGAERLGFDDSGWRKLDLPHDWSIEDLPGTNSPFTPDSISGVSGGFTVGGTAWYRKAFDIPADGKGKRFVIQFDGVYMNAEVWLNGESLGSHPYGYTTFWFDITSKLKYGASNTISVKVENEGENSRWYSGSGIYRHVWLKMMNPVHVGQWGVGITTPEVSTTQSRVNVTTSVANDSGATSTLKVVTTILNPANSEVAETESSRETAAGETADLAQDLLVKTPQLWSIETPVLYTAITDVYNGTDQVDHVEAKFGIRKLEYDAVNGFRLNGVPIKLKGGCVHHDNGVLGARGYDRAEERRVELLKASGYNAIRSAHNPPSPAFLAACDRLGMLVIDETFDCWRDGKNPFDYHLYFDRWWQKDVDSMLKRDRNHPSIIMWSIGNEIPGSETPDVATVAKLLADYIRKAEPTRPVVSAVNTLSPRKDAYFAALDVAGYNYARDFYESDHKRNPSRIMVATESYPLEAYQYWMDVVDHPWVIGDFVWTSFDYIGEASIGWRGYLQEQNFYPWNLAYCGDIDVCGWKRPQSYYRDALWKTGQISIFVQPPVPSFPLNPHREWWSKWHWLDAVADWNWPENENKPLEVSVYSSCEEVELTLNGKSLGRKKTDRSTQFMAKWSVPYQAGALRAIGYSNGREVNHSELRTAAAPATIKLSADRDAISASNEDLSYVTVELVDQNGVRNPKAENLVRFEIEGPGSIAGVGNANPISLESYQQPQRRAWQGRCLVVIKSGSTAGDIILKATVDGLPSQSIRIRSVSAT